MFKIDIENTSDLNAAIPPLKEIAENKDEKGEDKEAQKNVEAAEQESENMEDKNEKIDISGDVSEKDEKSTKTSVSEKDREKYWSKLKKEREEKAKLSEQLLHF